MNKKKSEIICFVHELDLIFAVNNDQTCSRNVNIIMKYIYKLDFGSFGTETTLFFFEASASVHYPANKKNVFNPSF